MNTLEMNKRLPILINLKMLERRYLKVETMMTIRGDKRRIAISLNKLMILLTLISLSQKKIVEVLLTETIFDEFYIYIQTD